MAVVIVKSGTITNRDSSPQVKNNPTADGGRLRAFCGAVGITSGDSVGSTYIVGQVPSNARIHQLRISSDADMGTTTTVKCGLYRTTADGSAAVSASLFASAYVLNAGAVSNIDITHQSGTFSIANAEKPIWQALGLSSDPSIMYDVVLTLDGACDGSGNAVVKAEFTI